MPPQQRSSNAADDIVEPLPRHSTVGADRMLRFHPVQSDGIERRKSFIQEFTASKGPPQIVILVMLLALGFGSTIGVVRVRVVMCMGDSFGLREQASHF